jgi:hypothetical protein
MREYNVGDYIATPHDSELYLVLRAETDWVGDRVYVLKGVHDGGTFKATAFVLEQQEAKKVRGNDKA